MFPGGVRSPVLAIMLSFIALNNKRLSWQLYGVAFVNAGMPSRMGGMPAGMGPTPGGMGGMNGFPGWHLEWRHST